MLCDRLLSLCFLNCGSGSRPLLDWFDKFLGTRAISVCHISNVEVIGLVQGSIWTRNHWFFQWHMVVSGFKFPFNPSNDQDILTIPNKRNAMSPLVTSSSYLFYWMLLNSCFGMSDRSKFPAFRSQVDLASELLMGFGVSEPPLVSLEWLGTRNAGISAPYLPKNRPCQI